MFSISNFITAPKAGLAVRRKAPVARRGSFRVVAHGGVGGSGGPQYPGKDKPFGSEEASGARSSSSTTRTRRIPRTRGAAAVSPDSPRAHPRLLLLQLGHPLRAPAFQRFVGICPRAPTSAPSGGAGGFSVPSGAPGYQARRREIVDPDNIDPENSGRSGGQAWTPPPANPTPSTPYRVCPAPPPPAPSGGAGDFSVPPVLPATRPAAARSSTPTTSTPITEQRANSLR